MPIFFCKKPNRTSVSPVAESPSQGANPGNPGNPPAASAAKPSQDTLVAQATVNIPYSHADIRPIDNGASLPTRADDTILENNPSASTSNRQSGVSAELQNRMSDNPEQDHRSQESEFSRTAAESSGRDGNLDSYEAEYNLRQDMIKNNAIIGAHMIPITAVVQDYTARGPGRTAAAYSAFAAQASLLREDFRGIRRIAPDGNCFYRAYMFCLLENLMLRQDDAEWEAFLARVDDTFEKACQTHERIVLEDPFDIFKECVADIRANVRTSDDLADLLTDQKKTVAAHDEKPQSNGMQIEATEYAVYVPYIARLACSAYMNANKMDVEPFLPEDMTIERFINTEVEPPGKDADNIQIMCTARQFNAAVRIVCLDPSLGKSRPGVDPACKYCHEIILPEDLEVRATLLFRPGHYEVLYPKESKSMRRASSPDNTL